MLPVWCKGISNRIPQLKADQQYQPLMDDIQACESHLELARTKYNQAVTIACAVLFPMSLLRVYCGFGV